MTTIDYTILNQMGGINKIAAMTGAKNFVSSGTGIKFQFPKCKKTNIVKIDLNDDDLYDVEFFKLNMRKLECQSVEKFEGAFAEDLKSIFEKMTGLDLSL